MRFGLCGEAVPQLNGWYYQ